MSVLGDFFDFCCGWLSTNWGRLAFSAVGIVIVYVAYSLLARQIANLQKQRKLEAGVAFGLTRAFKWLSVLIIFGVIFAQFGIEVGIVAGFLALAGGTIVGFAAMSTIGNAIAGIIVMVSRPFKIGDRILFKKQFADVVAIDLIYTRMRTLDNVLISIPNQELLTSEIDNFGKKTTVRRSCSVSVAYDVSSERVEAALLEAADRADGVLKDPKPYVWVTSLGDFAVEYTLYTFVNQIRRLPEVDGNMRRTVLEACKEHGIDISTPRLLRSVE